MTVLSLMKLSDRYKSNTSPFLRREKKICDCIIIKVQSIKTLNNKSQDKETSVWKENSYRSLCSTSIKRGFQHQRQLKTIISNSKEPLCVKDSPVEERFLWRGLDQSVFCLSLSLCWHRKNPTGNSLSLNCSKRAHNEICSPKLFI